MEQKLHAALRVLVKFAHLEDDFELNRAINGEQPKRSTSYFKLRPKEKRKLMH